MFSAMQFSLALWALLTIAAPALCLSDRPSSTDYVQRFGHSVATLGNFLYVDGGLIEQYENGHTNKSGTLQVNTTLLIPLDSSWTNSTLEMGGIGRSNAPGIGRGALWVDDTKQSIHLWGESIVNGIVDNSTIQWRLTADGSGGGFWQFEDLDGTAQITGLKKTTGGAYTTCYDTGFLLGGQMTINDEESTNVYRRLVPGLITRNMTSNTWANESATDFTPHGTSVGAEAVCVPSFGPNGLVLFLGGITSSGDDWGDSTYSIFNSGGVAFDTLAFYDPFAKQWYSQIATGSRPTPRHEFCAVGVQGPQNTFEIYVFSGYATHSSSTLSDLYVLSLPGFVWFKANYSSSAARAYARCATTGDSQMIVVGGAVDSDSDPWAQGIGVFDLPSMSQKSSYDHQAAPYDSPQAVKDWYSNGGLDTVSWSSDEVKNIFLAQKSNSSPTSTSSGNSGGSSTPAPGDVNKEANAAGLSPGQIAGVAVGGAAFLALLAGIAWCLLRRKRQPVTPDWNKVDEAAPFPDPYHWVPPLELEDRCKDPVEMEAPRGRAELQ